MQRIIFILLFTISIFFPYPVNSSEKPLKDQKKIKLGWDTPGVYRVFAEGNPDPVLKDRAARRESALNSAIFNAMKKITNKFVRERIAFAKNPMTYSTTGTELTKEYKDIIKNGKVIDVQFKDDDSCSIRYEVSARFLRERIRGNLRK